MLSLRNTTGMFMLTIIFVVFCFLLMRPYALLDTTLKATDDDDSYFAHATSIIYGDWPHYKNEYYVSGEKMPKHPVGAGVMAAPAVFIFSMIDRIQDAPIVKHRTMQNNLHSWSLFGFVIATFVYFWLAIWLCYAGLRRFVSRFTATFSCFLMIYTQGLLVVVFQRPVFSHPYEFFCQACLFYLLCTRNEQNRKFQKMPYISIIVGVLIGFLTLVRYNDVFYSLIWPIALLGFKNGRFTPIKNWKAICLSYVVGLILITIFALYPMYVNHYIADTMHTKTYMYYVHSHGFHRLETAPTFLALIKLIAHSLFGLDHGLIYTAPYILIGLVCFLALKKYPLKRNFLVLLMAVILEFYVGIRWSYGSFYTYRYITFSMAVLCLLPFACFVERIMHNKLIIWALSVYAIVPIMSMLVFQGVTIDPIYQIHVWSNLIAHPSQQISLIIEGGPVYLIYLVAYIIHHADKLPHVVLQKYNYPDFSFKTLLRLAILYFLPFILYFISRVQHRKLEQIR